MKKIMKYFICKIASTLKIGWKKKGKKKTQMFSE